VDISQTLDNLSSANIKLLSNPGVSPETKVQIKQGYNGQEVTTFTGLVDTIERSNVDDSYTVQARDMLKKALDTFLVQEVKFGIDVVSQTYFYSTYDSAGGGTFVVHEYASLAELETNHPETVGNITNEGAKAEAVVQWLLHMSGLAEGTEIQVDDTEFFIGDLTPAKFHLTSVYDAAMQIANLIGWRVFCDTTGVCRFKKRPRNPSSFYPSWNYYDEQEPYNIHKLTRNNSNIDLRTYVEVRGASGIRYVARGTSPFLGNTPYRGVLISDELIDTPGMATFVGNRVLGDLNREKITVALEADGNPKLVPGSTVNINSKVSSGKYLVESINTTMSAEAGYRTSLNGSAFYGDTAFEEPPLDIEATFTALQVIGIGDPQYMVEFDGSTSFSSVGPITRYVWTFPDLVQDSADATVWYAFRDTTITGGNSVTISLQVFDGLGNTDTVSSGITLAALQEQATIKYRHLYAALNTVGVASIDGGNTWNSLAIPAISVAASNFAISGSYTPSGYGLFGGSDGIIYKTVDAALTSYTVFDAASPVLDLNIPELDGSHASAGTEDGGVYKSVDSGESWTQIGDFAFPILQVKYDYTDYDRITILGSGANNAFITFDSGGSWTNLSIGVNGLWLADSNVKNYVAHTTGIKNITDNTEIASGTVAFPALTYAINSDDNAAPAAGIMTVDQNGQHYIYSGGLQPTQLNSTNKTKHMIRDGEVPFLVYYAVASGVGKSLDKNVTMSGLYYPSGSTPPGGWGYKVAYGPLSGPQPQARLLWAGSHLSGSPGGSVFGYLAGSGGTGAWTYLPDSASFGGDIVAVTAGYAAVGNSNTIDVGFITFVVTPQAFPSYTSFDDPAYGGGLHAVCASLCFGRDPAINPPKLFGLVTSGPNGSVPFIQVFNDIYNNPTSISSAGGGSLVSQVYTVNISAKGKETVMCGMVDGIFASNIDWRLYNADVPDMSHLDDTHGLWIPTKNAGLSTDWYTISKRTGDTHYFLVNPNGGSPIETVIPVAVVNTIYDSSVDSTVLYWADSAGVYKADSYGTGSIVPLFTPDVGFTVATFSVTHNAAETADYLTVTLDGAGTDSPVRYSLDGGSGWTAVPDLPGTKGFNTGCWYIAER